MAVTVNISKDDCENIAEFLEIYFFQNIRDDTDLDNIEYVHSLIHAIEELRKVSHRKTGDSDE